MTDLLKCPKCKANLLERVRRADGVPFLGCSAFPDCRYTRPIVRLPGTGKPESRSDAAIVETLAPVQSVIDRVIQCATNTPDDLPAVRRDVLVCAKVCRALLNYIGKAAVTSATWDLVDPIVEWSKQDEQEILKTGISVRAAAIAAAKPDTGDTGPGTSADQPF